MGSHRLPAKAGTQAIGAGAAGYALLRLTASNHQTTDHTARGVTFLRRGDPAGQDTFLGRNPQARQGAIPVIFVTPAATAKHCDDRRYPIEFKEVSMGMYLA
jgi:hypothetical protein